MRFIFSALKSVVATKLLLLSALAICGSAQAITPSTGGLDLVAKVDGIGSLVDPRSGGACNSLGNFGCTRDELILVGDGVTRSAGLFQVLKDPLYCNSITLTGLPPQGAVLLAKSWNERFPAERGHQFSRAYETYSSSATIPLPANTDWSTIAVVSQFSLTNGERRTIRATCNAAAYGSAATVIYNTAGGLGAIFLVDLNTDASTWSGNGSLISTSGNYATSDSAGGYGRDKDVVGEFGDGRYSAQYFQVFTNGGSCNNVRLTSNGGTTLYRVKSKSWDAASWTTRVGIRSLPVTIPVSTVGVVPGYFLLSVEMLDSASRTQITASCV